MSDFDFDEIRKQVAIKHNVLLGKEDPILVTVTINEIVLKQYIKLLTESNDEAQRNLTISLQQHIDQSKETAGKIITDASNYVSEQIQNTVTAAINDAANKLHLQITEAQVASRDSASNSRRAHLAKSGATLAAMLSCIAALISVVAVVVLFFR